MPRRGCQWVAAPRRQGPLMGTAQHCWLRTDDGLLLGVLTDDGHYMAMLAPNSLWAQVNNRALVALGESRLQGSLEPSSRHPILRGRLSGQSRGLLMRAPCLSLPAGCRLCSRQREEPPAGEPHPQQPAERAEPGARGCQARGGAGQGCARSPGVSRGGTAGAAAAGRESRRGGWGACGGSKRQWLHCHHH